MKRLSLALTALGLSAGAFAALPAATDPTLVSVPQLPGGFVIGGSGFYLQPTNSNGDLDYATTNTNNSSGTFFASNLQNLDPGYDWGWGVNVGYIFPNTGNDINLSYLQLNTSDTAAVTGNPNSITPVGNNIDFVNPQSVIAQLIAAGVLPGSFSFNQSFGSATAKVEYDLDQVDLTAGQYINVGCRLSLHPYAGLRWAQLDRKINSTYSQGYSGTIAAGTVQLNDAVNFAEKSDFEGIGPIAGLDASYYVGMGFGIVGHFDSALLVGNINTSTNETMTESLVVPNSVSFTFNNQGTANFTASNTRRIVPVLDAKLGADYTYVFNNAANSDLTLEAGWMVSNYFNAIDRLQTATALNFAGSSFTQAASLISRTTSDFGMQGPYVSLVAHI